MFYRIMCVICFSLLLLTACSANESTKVVSAQSSVIKDIDGLIEKGKYSEAVKQIEKNELLNTKNKGAAYNYQSLVSYNKLKKLYDQKEYTSMLSAYISKPIKDKFIKKDVLKIVKSSFDELIKQDYLYSAKRYFDKLDNETQNNLKDVKEKVAQFSQEKENRESQLKTMSPQEVDIHDYLGYMEIGLYDDVAKKTTLRTDNIGENFFNLSTAYNNFYNNPDILYISGQESLPETFLNNIKNPLPEVTGYISKLKQEIENKKNISKGNYGVSIGMTKDAVLNSSWGKPRDINTTTTAYGSHEQWVYGGANYLYFDNGILTSIQN